MSTDFNGESKSEAAPGTLELVREFVNTVQLPDGADRLDTMERASAWCLSHGLAPTTSPSHAAQLRAFRETLRDLLFANNGEGDAASAWAEMRPFLASTRLGLTVDPDHGLELKPEDKGPVASLLAIVFEAQTVGTWPRLRACRKPSCRWAYYDQTKNASRAWCSMATCGNQMKAHRRRQRERHRQN